MTRTRHDTPNPPIGDELDKILQTFAEGIMDYEERMLKAGAPNIRFIHDYVEKAKKDIVAEREKAVHKAEDTIFIKLLSMTSEITLRDFGGDPQLLLQIVTSKKVNEYWVWIKNRRILGKLKKNKQENP